jgi:Na+-transporting NADH:ubiquinone oxidoreductase subunit D
LVLKAFLYSVSKELSIFVGLIITNCIVMGRADTFAMHNNVKNSFIDGLGNSFGYGLILIIVAIFRELFGSGAIYGFTIIPSSLYDSGYIDNGLMLLAPGAFIVLGLIIWLQRTKTGFIED